MSDQTDENRRRGEPIEVIFERLTARIASNESRLAAIEKCVFANGRPSLEDRMSLQITAASIEARRYADEMVEHKHSQSRQMYMDVKESLSDDIQEIKATAKENARVASENARVSSEKLDKLNWIVSGAIGGAALITTVLGILIPHLWPVAR